MVAPDVPKWTDTTTLDASRQNLTSIIRNLGTYLNALTKTEHTLVVANDTSAGYIKDHVYLFAQDGVSKIDLTLVSDHFHSGSGDGGALTDIFDENPYFTELFLSRTNDLQKAQWIQAVSGSGAITDDTDGTTGERSIKLSTGATNASKAQISYPHISLKFGIRAIYEFKARISTMSSLAFHSGVNCDDIDAVDSNTRKFNAEICTATNNNWWLRTADGTNKGATDTTIAATTNRVYILIDHFPNLGTPETDIIVDGVLTQRTANIPIDQTSTHINLLKHSIKNSTTADRPIFIYPTRLRFNMSTLWA